MRGKVNKGWGWTAEIKKKIIIINFGWFRQKKVWKLIIIKKRSDQLAGHCVFKRRNWICDPNLEPRNNIKWVDRSMTMLNPLNL